MGVGTAVISAVGVVLFAVAVGALVGVVKEFVVFLPVHAAKNISVQTLTIPITNNL
jgi:hypothetical protein